MSRKMVSNNTVKKRLIFLFFCMGIAVLALIGRLFWLQLVIAGELEDRAWEQWTRSVPARAPRGNILDREGNLLAGSAGSVTILARPAHIGDMDKTVRLLSPVLEIDEERLRELLSQERDSVYLKRRMTADEAYEVRKLDLEGIIFTVEPRRFYPHGRLASQLLGFVGIDEGLYGLEIKYEDLLKGRDGRVQIQTDGRGRPVPQGRQVFIPPANGHDLILTIDQNIQFILEQEMDRVMLESLPKGIAAVALDPRTGEVLAIAGKPDFDPNYFAQYEQELWKLPPVSHTFEPGSTFKLVTLAAAIEEGYFNASEGFYCGGWVTVAGAPIGCWTRFRGGHGAIDFTKVVLSSCNPGFVALGNRIGADRLMDYVRAFGFGRRTGLDVIGEGTGILFTPRQYGPVEAATTSFGQGVSVTPIQQVMAVAAMANGGYLMKPYVVREIRDSSGNSVQKREPQAVRRVLSEETTKEVTRIMELVVTEGSGRNAIIDGYRVAGKTGTAQKVGPDGRYIAGEYILSFIGFAPAEDPRVLLYVAVDAPQVGPQWGSQVSAPMFKRMMERILKYLNVPPTTAQVAEIPVMVQVPDLMGKTLGAAAETIETSGLIVRFIGEGNVILNQTPKAGASVPLHTQILVYLGGGDNASEDVPVPDLTGKSMKEAGDILGMLGLRMSGTGSGMAVRQDPLPGTMADSGSVVYVEFSAPGDN